MVNTYSISLCLVTALALNTVTSARYIQLQGTDERDKRQIGDLKTAEYLALITLSQMHRLPSHCDDIACGLVDVVARLAKRTMSDQRLAELQALIALSKGQGIPIGHGQIDPWSNVRPQAPETPLVYKGIKKFSLSDTVTINNTLGIPSLFGKRRKRSIGSIFGTLNTDQKMRVLNRLLTRGDDSGEANNL